MAAILNGIATGSMLSAAVMVGVEQYKLAAVTALIGMAAFSASCHFQGMGQ